MSINLSKQQAEKLAYALYPQILKFCEKQRSEGVEQAKYEHSVKNQEETKSTIKMKRRVSK